MKKYNVACSSYAHIILKSIILIRVNYFRVGKIGLEVAEEENVMTAVKETKIDSKTEKTETIAGESWKKEIVETERIEIEQKTEGLIVGKTLISLMRETMTGRGLLTEAPKEEAKILTEANGSKISVEKVNQALAEKCTGMREEEDFRVTEVSLQRLRKRHRVIEILA